MLSRASRCQRGFTLIELMIAVVIIGIIAAIALPGYSQYVVRSNRVAAQSYLMELSQAQVQYLADSRTYADDVDALGLPVPDSVAARYDIKIELDDGPPRSFLITATPKADSPQAGDDTLSINQAGTRLPGDKW